VAEMESEIQELTSRVSKSNHQALQDKIKSLEEEVTMSKNQILLHNKQIQKFIEEGNRTIINQKEQIDTSTSIISRIKEDMVCKLCLIV
jgi:tRNA A37 threonylcarbamoyladenosine dehydratase